ncbi:MAG: Fructose-bisphosphate aldolase [Candidatus Curtissbacteria bacterium GW2011_GWA1_40_16]|uniref:Probable fructose-bisphosphate aldolase class 1 n=1 Tax=Candidatus Curtissbacteria bacterium GW2011_GWA1_40_16 TaxID=1618405 RepID=A0A0G0RAU6_9BACT|nr:MAG: Fructose-bisphosphate aldolase [Candidatus Curtissbacteria bacterium GW2011_GWA1_40_16]
MDLNKLKSTAKEMVSSGRGILAADESDKTIKKRFDTIGVESSPENHRIYRQLLFKTPQIEKYISGVILFDETIRQSTDEGTSFTSFLQERGIVPGIKVDGGTTELRGGSKEKVTLGIDGLADRVAQYSSLGARFSKWRAVITIGEGIPTDECIEENSDLLAQFAKISQEGGLVPIVEPEVLMEGEHDIDRCEIETYKTLKSVFSFLSKYGVEISGMLLKPNMIISGKENLRKSTTPEVAAATLRCFSEVLPKELPGVVFLSGGQSPEEATCNLNELNKRGFFCDLSFSFGRALQEPVLKAWYGKTENIKEAQKKFLKRARLNCLARRGEYSPDLEDE